MLGKLLSLIGVKRPREDANKISKLQSCRCPICTDIIVNCVITNCGHSFCEYCLNQSMIYAQACPLCRKQLKVNSFIPCKALNFSIRAQLNSQQLAHYRAKKQQHDEWKQSKLLKNTSVGMKIDALDTEGIWCAAVIKLKIDNGEKVPFLYVHYLDWDSSYNELISESSHRVAPAGFYTSKNNIPRYRFENPVGNIAHDILTDLL